MEDVCKSYGVVHQVVKEANVPGYVTPRLRRRMDQTIDTLKTFRAPADHISMAERNSVTLHALEWASLRRDVSRLAADRQAFSTLEQQWLSAPMPVA